MRWKSECFGVLWERSYLNRGVLEGDPEGGCCSFYPDISQGKGLSEDKGGEEGTQGWSQAQVTEMGGKRGVRERCVLCLQHRMGGWRCGCLEISQTGGTGDMELVLKPLTKSLCRRW